MLPRDAVLTPFDGWAKTVVALRADYEEMKFMLDEPFATLMYGGVLATPLDKIIEACQVLINAAIK